MTSSLRSASRAMAAIGLAVLAACGGDNVTGTDAAKLKTGSLLVTTSGLPNGISANLTLERGQATRQVTSGSVQTAIETGSYTLVAATVTADGLTYDPQPATQAVLITNNQQTSTSVAYTRRSGTVNVTVGGLPSGGNAAIILTPPSGSNIAVTGSTQIANSVPGAWRMNASPVVNGGFTFTPSPTVQEGTLTANGVLPFNVQYTLATGAIAVAVTGLPVGANGGVNITGPNGYAHNVTSTSTITDLAPGTYTVLSTDVVIAGTTYRPTPATQEVVVTASTIASPAVVAYSPLVSTLVVGVINAPAGASNIIQVSGPGGFTRTASSTTTYSDIAPGMYTVNASNAITALGTWSPSPTTAQKTLTAGGRDSVGVTYTLATGSIAVAVTGVATGSVMLTGPGGYTKNVSTTQTVVNLVPGTYTVAASDVFVNNVTYTPAPASQQVVVTASVVAAPATVTYSAQQLNGSVTVTMTGLPGAVSGQAVLFGPSENINKVTININSSQTVMGLPIGTYSLTASDVSSGGTDYSAAPATQNVTVTAGGNTAAAITYTGAAAGSDDLSVQFAYVTQATQKQDGSVSLVAGRDALLRAFVVNNRANTLTPTVRVRVYNGATEVQSTVLNAPEPSVRLAIAENVLGSTWNVVIPGANVQPNMRILVDVDPSNTFPESNEINNVWPSGGPQTISVLSVPDFNLKFVPVTVEGVTGNVNETNKEEYLRTLRRMFPIRTVNSSVREPFTSTAPALTSGGGNWLTVLNEMRILQQTEGPLTTHFYGVVKVGYSSGVAGYGYVPGRAAMGWDHLPSGDGVAAHEWGHNFSRPHSPCGGAAGPDPSYPYAGGSIGVFGWNFATGALVQTTATDIMGYCNNQWISDYTWSQVLTYRQSSGLVAAGASGNVIRDGLLVSGTIVNGRIQLDPAYRINDVPAAQTTGATHQLDALDKRGNVLASITVSAQKVDHGPNQSTFVTVLPWSERLERALTTLRVRDLRSPLVSATTTSSTAAATVDDNITPVLPDPASTVDRPRSNRARIRFNAGQFRGAMVRDAATGQIIAFVKQSGDEIVARDGRALDIVYSDGVRSVTRRNIR